MTKNAQKMAQNDQKCPKMAQNSQNLKYFSQ